MRECWLRTERKGESMQTLYDFFDGLKTYFQANVVDVVKTITPKDAIDIFLLGLILYFLYRFICDRRAGKLLIGLAFIWVVSIASEALELHALHFILGDFRQIGLIAVLILFQPELRSVLERWAARPSPASIRSPRTSAIWQRPMRKSTRSVRRQRIWRARRSAP